ncbi:sensor histidine kinase [Dongia soli]|uniref:histidine kinase n=1 Tax=Dongia soli TaxID=600628 RepID=A0ABU5EEH4_9PROT|nr:sensor histidine kinase [Dongia soli]MDY0884770.1 sensor histidine kinase [Dongia soli]
MKSRVINKADKADVDVMLVETRHRLANCFQLLSSLTRLRSRSVESEEARDLLAWFSGVIVAMGRLQQGLAGAEGQGFAAYLRESARFWNTIGTDQRVSVSVEAMDGQSVRQSVNDQQATMLTLIINELVTNCLEHAFVGREAGEITIRFLPVADRHMLLEVADDGLGHDAALARLDSGTGDGTDVSSGLLLVRYLAAGLRGRFEIAPAQPSGMIARVVFPTVQRIEDDQAAGA